MVTQSPRLTTGDTVAHFVIESELGRGGMGVVYRAADLRLRRTVALKLLDRQLSAEPERRARFLREARAAAALNHSRIATVYEIGETDLGVFIAMELVEGESLRARLERAPLPLDRAIAITRGIVEGLQHAHQRGVVHRDLKPENVMLTATDEVKLLDFGLAKQADTAAVEPTSSGYKTEDGRILGTPGYMSPEQAMGRSVDFRTDLFSTGVVLYELATGVRPFRGSAMEQLLATARDEPPAASTIQASIPPALDRLIAQCLAKAPEQRPPNAGALLSALDEIAVVSIATPPTTDDRNTAAAVATQARPTTPARRRRLAVALAVTLVLVAAAGVGAAWRASASRARADVTLPPGTPRDAVVAYQAGLQLERDGANAGAWERYEEAARADRGLAQPHLRMAIAGQRGNPAHAREHLARATELRASLGIRDQALLDAFGPCIRHDSDDPAACAHRLAKAAAEFPDDAEMQALTGELFFNAGLLDEATRYSSAAVRLDPKFGSVLIDLGYQLAYLDRRSEALASFERAATIAPSGYSYITYRSDLYAEDGRCDLIEADALRFVAAAPSLGRAYAQLLSAYVARQRPEATLREVLRQQLTRTSESERANVSDDAELRLAILTGDFTKAEAAARSMLARAERGTAEADYAVPVRMLLDLYAETDRNDAAGALAETILDRRAAWVTDERGDDFAIAADPTPQLLAALERAGRRSPAARQRAMEQWIAHWRSRSPSFYQRYLWIYGIAATADTVDEAKAAVASRSAYEPIPRFRPLSNASFGIGKTLLLADLLDEARPEITIAARHCAVFEHPFESVRAQLLLGESEARQGNTAAACTAYQNVIARWGHATPAAKSAVIARRRLRELACRP